MKKDINLGLARELLKIFSLPLLILFLHFLFGLLDIRICSIYGLSSPCMHFFGGVAIGISYSLFLRVMLRIGFMGKTNKILFFVFVISLVATTILVWEFGEFTLDSIDGGTRQPSLADTMSDLFLGLVGGILGYFTFLLIKRRKLKEG